MSENGNNKATEYQRHIDAVLESLTPRVRDLLRQHPEILAQGSKERTLEEPTQQLEETQNRIREFERRAFAKLGIRGKVPDDDPGAPAPLSPK